MTSTVPDGIQLCGSDNAVAELDIHTLGAHIPLIIVLQGITTGHCTSLSSGYVEQTDLNGNRDIVTMPQSAVTMPIRSFSEPGTNATRAFTGPVLFDRMLSIGSQAALCIGRNWLETALK